MNARILAVVCALALLAGCAPAAPSGEQATPKSDFATPVAHTPLPSPTPQPEATTLEKAFALGKEVVRATAQGAGDPLAVFPFSAQRLLTKEELDGATPRDLEWGWREIAARRGAKEYKAFDFTDREWYQYDPDFNKLDFSQIEASNIIFMRNSALEHYGNMKIVKNNRAQADLDGDGQKERFSLTADRFSDGGTLQIGGEQFAIELPQIDNRLYLCDLMRADGKMELAIPFTRPGGDYRLAFFAYDAQGLIMLGDIQGDRDTIRIYGDGTIQAYALDTELCALRYPQKYRLADDRLHPLPTELRRLNIEVALGAQITLRDAAGDEVTFEQGAQVILVAATPQREYVLYEPASGRYASFPLEEGKIAGFAPGELFIGLPTLA